MYVQGVAEGRFLSCALPSTMAVKDEATPVRRRRPHSWEEAGHFMETTARTKSARTGERGAGRVEGGEEGGNEEKDRL